MSNKRNWASLLLLLCLVASLLVFPYTGNVSADTGHRFSGPHFTLVTDSTGRQLVRAAFPAKPPAVKMPVANLPELPKAASSATSPNVRTAGTTTVLANVPAFEWVYGCSPTAAAMLFGYYDRIGYNNMYTGTVNGGVCPLDNSAWGTTPTGDECAISATHLGLEGRATRGHVDDYWIAYGDNSTDPYVTDNVSEHALDCTADFMGTSQWKYLNTDGNTWFWYERSGDPLYDYIVESSRVEVDGCHGMRLFAESRGYTVLSNYTQLIQGLSSNPALGFTFANFQSEINAGRPVIIQVYGHSMLGYGYDTATSNIYIHDTWDYSPHTMPWGGSYSGRQQWAVTVIQLQALTPPAPILLSPTAGSTVNGNSISFSWNASTGATYYYLCVQKVSDSSVVFNTNVGNVLSSIQSGFPNDGTQYKWGVAACNSAGFTSSTFQNFTNGSAATKPPAPILASPTAGSTVNGNSISFSWNASTGATYYYLCVQKVSDSSVVFNTNVGNVLSSIQSGFPNDGTQYKWGVAACNSAGFTSSTFQNFTNGSAATKPPAPILASPTAGSTVNGNSISFSWNASTGATYYYLCVQKVSDSSVVFNTNVGNVLSSIQSGFPNDGTQYKWGVAACNSAGFTSSTFQNFTNGSAATKPPAPILASPTAGSTVNGNSISFSWNASTGATYYYLCVQKVSDSSVVFNTNVGNVLSSTQSGFPNDGTQYKWGVAACNSAGFTSSTFQNFTNGSAATKPPAPILASPTAGSTVNGNSISFSWNASTGATYYYLCVQKVSDSSVVFNTNVGNVLSSTQSGFPNDGTQYKWGVAACNSAGFTSSTFQNFTNGP